MPTTRRVLAAVGVALAVTAGALAGSAPASAYTTRIDLGRGPRTPWISLIGDSTLSAVRWTNNYGPLERYNYTFDAESCRRTLARSCRGREGYAPQTSIQTMQRLQGDLGQVLIMMTGYDDPGTGFPAAVDAVVDEAKRQGLHHVIWLTMRTADVTYVSPTYRSNSYTFRDNNRILLQKAQQYDGYLQVADWATYSASQRSWVGSDGIHLTAAGAVAVATFAADMAAQVFSGATITPPPTAADGWITLRRGDRGPQVAMLQNSLIARGMRLVGGADGIFGVYTQRAVAAYQSRRGDLVVSGRVDALTAAALGLASEGLQEAVAPLTAWTDVAAGARGATVAGIQRAVMNAGIYLRGGADGVFGRYTRAAVVTYQQQRGLPGTGVVDEATAIAMGLYTPPPPPEPPPTTTIAPPPPPPPPATPAPTEAPTTTAEPTTVPPPTTAAPTTTSVPADTTTTALVEPTTTTTAP